MEKKGPNIRDLEAANLDRTKRGYHEWVRIEAQTFKFLRHLWPVILQYESDIKQRDLKIMELQEKLRLHESITDSVKHISAVAQHLEERNSERDAREEAARQRIPQQRSKQRDSRGDLEKMLCDPIPEPSYRRELLTDFGLGKDVQPIKDLVWMAFIAGYSFNQWEINTPKDMKMQFRRWLSTETGLDMEQISVNWE